MLNQISDAMNVFFFFLSFFFFFIANRQHNLKQYVRLEGGFCWERLSILLFIFNFLKKKKKI